MCTSRSISRSKILAWLIAPFAAATLLACKQAEDEPCQVDRDCDDGLVCFIEGASARGVCIREEDEEERMRDIADEPLPEDPSETGEDAGAEQAGASG